MIELSALLPLPTTLPGLPAPPGGASDAFAALLAGAPAPPAGAGERQDVADDGTPLPDDGRDGDTPEDQPADPIMAWWPGASPLPLPTPIALPPVPPKALAASEPGAPASDPPSDRRRVTADPFADPGRTGAATISTRPPAPSAPAPRDADASVPAAAGAPTPAPAPAGMAPTAAPIDQPAGACLVAMPRRFVDRPVATPTDAAPPTPPAPAGSAAPSIASDEGISSAMIPAVRQPLAGQPAPMPAQVVASPAARENDRGQTIASRSVGGPAQRPPIPVFATPAFADPRSAETTSDPTVPTKKTGADHAPSPQARPLPSAAPADVNTTVLATVSRDAAPADRSRPGADTGTAITPLRTDAPSAPILSPGRDVAVSVVTGAADPSDLSRIPSTSPTSANPPSTLAPTSDVPSPAEQAAPAPSTVRPSFITAGNAAHVDLAPSQVIAPAVATAIARPARQVFAAAIDALSVRPRRKPADNDDLVAGTITATDARPATAAPPPAAAAQTSLDLKQERGLSAMIDHIEALRDRADASDTRIRLVPDALGSVDVAVRQDGDAVHVRFTTETDAARAAIAEARPQLTAIAESRGVKLAGTSVETGTGGNAPHQPRYQPAPPPAPPRAPRIAAMDDAASTTRLA